MLDAVEQDGFGNWLVKAANVVIFYMLIGKILVLMYSLKQQEVISKPYYSTYVCVFLESKDHYNEVYVNSIIGEGRFK